MVKVYINEARYGDAVCDTNIQKTFKDFEEMLNYISSLDNTIEKENTHLLCKLNSYRGIGVSINTNRWGSIYLYSFNRIETEKGIHYDSKHNYDKCSKELEIAIDQFVSKIKTSKTFLY